MISYILNYKSNTDVSCAKDTWLFLAGLCSRCLPVRGVLNRECWHKLNWSWYCWTSPWCHDLHNIPNPPTLIIVFAYYFAFVYEKKICNLPPQSISGIRAQNGLTANTCSCPFMPQLIETKTNVLEPVSDPSPTPKRFRSSKLRISIYLFIFLSEGSVFLVPHRAFHISAEGADIWKYIIVWMSIKSWEPALTASEWRTNTLVQTAQKLLIRKWLLIFCCNWRQIGSYKIIKINYPKQIHT